MRRADTATRDFDTFFAEEFPAIVRAAWFVVLDTEVAKEIAQEAFCRALQRWDRIQHYDRPGAWARTVAIRLAVRSRDRRRRERSVVESGLAGHSHGVDLDAPEVDNIVLEAALRDLPRQQRAALVLRYLCDLDVRELAGVIGCKPSTARVHLHRGRNALAEIIGVPDDVAR